MRKLMLLKVKLKAWTLHLGVSAMIFLPFLYLIWVRWFPPPMFFTDGGWQGLRIMLVVDLVIGPALTLLIYNPAKSRREKIFDFTCIGLVQAAALVYGYMNVESKRIQAVAFATDAFYAVPKDSYATQEISKAGWQALGERSPYWVYVREFESGKEKAAARVWELMEGVPKWELHMLYRPLLQIPTDAAAVKQLQIAAKSKDADFAALCRERQSTTGELCIGLRGYFAPAVLIFDQGLQLIDYRVGKSYFSVD